MFGFRQTVGFDGEALAAAHLAGLGYKILIRNYRTRLGEIDIIASHRGTIVFIEVKSRRSTRCGDPKWAITPVKQRRISMIALHYLKSQRRCDCRARFDVVTIRQVDGRQLIEVIANAFELAYT